MPWVKYTDKLENHAYPNPVLLCKEVDLGDLWTPNEEELVRIFGDKKSNYLKSWGRVGKKTNEMDAHYLGAKMGVKLHTDPGFLRYTHQIMIHVDEFELHGVNKVPTNLYRGTYFLVDTWSPHAVVARADAKSTPEYYVAASCDSKMPRDLDEVLPRLLKFIAGGPRLELLK